jgi:hypothetical protein
MEQVFDKINEFENIVLKPVFPGAKLKSSSVFGSVDKISNSFNGLLSTNGLFNGTRYQYSGENLFLHFTTFPVLSVILNSGFLRMSDFNCLNDKMELMFASEAIWGEKIVKKLKDQKCKIFTLSACESNIDTIQNKFMWHSYSGKGRGCAIEYKFSSIDIYNFSIGKIQYGKYNLTPIKKIKTLNELFTQTSCGFQVNDFPNFLIPIYAFHKDIKFKKEQEVRLLYYQDVGSGSVHSHLNEFRDFYKDDKVRNFIKIYLKGKNKFLPNNLLVEEEIVRHSPEVEIKRIFIGPEVTDMLETIVHLDMIRQENKQTYEIWRWDGNQLPYKIG